MQKIKRGDKVIVLAGKDKGKQGSVLKIIYTDTNPKYLAKAVVEGVNMVKKHKKADPSKNSPGSIVSKEMPIAGQCAPNIAGLNEISRAIFMWNSK